MAAYGQQIRAGQEIGWFIADIMIKLGLLGTVVGFVIMLGSVTNISSFDISVMKDVLTNMSGGMGVALYTTIAGLIFAMLLTVQYQSLERGADDLVALMTKVVEVQLAPHLNSQSGGAA
jgi:Biopolymer transport proteins